MKSLSKHNSNKFSSCFRPVVDFDAMLDSETPLHRSSSFRFACVPLPHKHHIHVSHPKYSHPHHPILHPHPPKRTLSLIIKAVVFETILNRRAKRSSSPCDRKIVSADSKTTPESPLSSSSSSQGSASSCSSLVLEPEKSSKSESNKAKQRERRGKTEKQRRLEGVGICLILASLTFTVLWDKYWGVILTSTWLYFFCVWEAKHHKRTEVANAKLSKTETKV